MPWLRDGNHPLQELPTADDLAVQLRLKPGPNGKYVDIAEEDITLAIQVTMAPRLKRASVAEREQVLSSFCAAHLPDLVRIFLNPPLPTKESGVRPQHKLYNAYLEALLLLTNNAYFAKFMASDHPVASSRNMIAEKLVLELVSFGDNNPPQRRRPPGILDDEWTMIRAACQLLHNVLVYRVGPAPTIHINMQRSITERLDEYLDEWIAVFKRRDADNTLPSLRGLLRNEPDSIRGARIVREDASGLEKCAISGCGARYDLYQCKRCKTVLYCGRRHQAEHWRDASNPHKLVCHETIY